MFIEPTCQSNYVFKKIYPAISVSFLGQDQQVNNTANRSASCDLHMRRTVMLT